METFSDLWSAIGFIRWPLTFAFVAVVALAAWSATRVYRSDAIADLRTKAWIDAILFWGAFAVIAGVLGSAIGVVIGAQSVEAAGEVSTRLVWAGLKVSMLSTVFGTLILAVASLLWFPLQLRWRLVLADEEEGGAVA